MKTWFLITAFIAVVLWIGIVQHSRLTELSGETAALECQLSTPGSVRSGRGASLIQPAVHISQDEMDFMREHFVSALARSSDYRLSPENRRKMLLGAAKFSAREMDALLGSLQSDPSLAEVPPGKTIEAMLEIFSGTAPAATLEFLQSHREVTHWDGHFSGAFHSLLMSNPSQGIRWFEDQESLANPDLQNSELRRSFLVTFARIDPDKMLARALSPGFASDPDTLSRLGIFVASTLNQPSECQQFFTVLRRIRQSTGPSTQLDKIRSDYISGISRELAASNFDDAQMIIDSEFSADEKLAFAYQVSNSPDFIDPEKWANWALKIDPAAWKDARKRKKASGDHPAIQILSNWARLDEAAAGKWLEKIPAGDLETKMADEFISTVARVNPDKASSYLGLLPEGKSKENLIRRIDEVRGFYSGDTKQRLEEDTRGKLGN